MAADISSLMSTTPPCIDPLDLWTSLVDLSVRKPIELNPKPQTRSAAVTIILRFTREGHVVDLTLLHGSDGLSKDNGLMVAVLGENAMAEVLFIKRSTNPRDRWSGHVALPGGRQEPDENLKTTATRETLEEIGLNLDSDDFFYIGALDDRYTMPINIRPFLISAHVFLQVRPGTVKPKLDAKEVASCRWVPISCFANAQIDFVSYPMRISTSRNSSIGLTLGNMNFPGINLPTGEEFFPELEDEDDDADSPQERPVYPYHLWGITLDIIEDLCMHLQLCRRGSISYLPRSLNPIVKIYVWHHQYVPHALKGATFWSSLLVVTSVASYFTWWKLIRRR